MRMAKLTIFLLVLLIAVSVCDARNSNRRRRRRRHPGTKPPHKGIDPDVQKAVDAIWKLDKDRAHYGTDFELCYQGNAKDGGDQAPNPLICKMNPKILNETIYKAFVALMDNYNPVEGKAEVITKEEIKEDNTFLDLVIESDLMKRVHSLLVNKSRASADPAKFRTKVYNLWFGPYARSSRSRVLDSSGFEHVFMGEVNGRKHNIGGFHNWIHLYKEEQVGHLNYLGYLKKTKSNLIFNFRFTWFGTLKPIGSAFFGTSPEFEMSLYTLIYMMGYNHAKIMLDGVQVTITCWPINHNRNIGTCYPSVY